MTNEAGLLHDARDPICGMMVSTATALSAVRNGQTYYFCCEGCRAKFLAGPAALVELKLLGAATMAGDAAAAPAAHACCTHQSGQRATSAHPNGAHEGPTLATPRSGYICPMCEGVWSPTPADCPRCGMPLEAASGTAAAADDAELRLLTRRLLVAGPLALLVMLLAMAPMWHVAPSWLSPRLSAWLQLALASVVVWYAGWPLWVRGVRSLQSRSANMFTLISLGTLAAYGYSAVATLFPHLIPAAYWQHGAVAVHFESAAMIVALVLLGQLFELRGRQRTGDAVGRLLELAPPVACRLTLSGDEETIELGEVRVGDRLRIRPGDKVPVDGRVVEGESTVDQSLLTGESLPAAVHAGDQLIGGALNGSGALVMQAEAVGSESLLGQIVTLVQQAQRSRAPIQRLADRVAGYFVPLVLVVALLAAVAWMLWGPEPRVAHALLAAVAVMIVACPCALGLATPMSVMVGIGRGAREGVLLREAAAIERLAQCQTLVLDKTGTLTQGQSQLRRIFVGSHDSSGPSGSNDSRSSSDSDAQAHAADSAPLAEQHRVLQLAAAVERLSEHPLAAAIVSAATERQLRLPTASGFVAEIGGGVAANVEQQRVAVGTQSYLQRQAVVEDAQLLAAAREAWSQGESVMFVAVDARMIGALVVADPLKPTSAAAVAELRKLGLRPIMLSGDHPLVAEAVGRSVGIEQVVAGVSPSEKQAYVRQLQSQGTLVAMAGDGVNDAPALAAADVGIAMGTGSDVALQSADVTLVQGDLQQLVKAVKLSRQMMRNIRQNLAFAFGYNMLSVPIAAGVLYPVWGWTLSPMVAAAAMSASSLCVIGNALRLRRVSLH